MEIESTGLRASIQAVCSVHFAPEDFIRTLAYSFDQQRYQKRLKRAEIGVLPVSQFYRLNVEQRYSTQDRSSIASPFGKIYLTSRVVVLLYIHPKTVQGTILLFLPYGVRTLLC